MIIADDGSLAVMSCKSVYWWLVLLGLQDNLFWVRLQVLYFLIFCCGFMYVSLMLG